MESGKKGRHEELLADGSTSTDSEAETSDSIDMVVVDLLEVLMYRVVKNNCALSDPGISGRF